MQEYVLGFVFDFTDKQVLLIKKTKPDWQKGLLNGIGGKVEESDLTYTDSIHYAMSRECREETSANVPSESWNHFCTMVGIDCPDGDWKVYCFSHILRGSSRYKSQFQTVEEEALFWVSLNEIGVTERRNGDQLLGNIPWLVGMALDHYINTNFRPVEVNYSRGFSLPLNL